MRLPLFLLALLTWQAALPSPGAAADGSFDAVVEKQRHLLLASPLSTPPDAVRCWAQQLDAHGAWPDINYQDTAHGAWSPRRHLERVVSMCRALLAPTSPLHGNGEVAAAVYRALDFWIATRPQCPNWWHNEIGTPGFMRDILFLLGDALHGPRRAGALEVMHQFKVTGEGANLVWSASLALDYGCLTHDDTLVSEAAARLANEIHVSTGEGIQPDFSFHQHGPRLQEFHYGSAYEHDAARLAWSLAGTRWALPPEKIRLLTDYMLRGQQWMSRWDFTVPSTIDRATSRPDSLKIGGIAGDAALLAETDPARRPELEEYRARLARRGTPLNGFRAFPRSDFACYQRPGFSFFVKTISTRTQGAEVGMNAENLKGWHLDSGDTYVLRQGDEYLNLAAVWDWSLLPGVTGVEGLDTVERQAFAGAVDDGQSGCAAMEAQTTDARGDAHCAARKAYFCHGDAVVCLVGGITAHADQRPARTALDQRRLRGAVTALDQTGQARTLSNGETELRGARWLWHDGLLYVPTTPTDLTVRTGPATGTWRAINASLGAEPVETPVFLPFLTHGANVEHGSAGYGIFPCPTLTRATAVARAPGYRLVRNDADSQAIEWDDGTLMAVFYAPGELHEGGRALLATDQPCLVLSRPGHLFASDPTRLGAQAQISVQGGLTRTASLPANGESVEIR